VKSYFRFFTLSVVISLVTTGLAGCSSGDSDEPSQSVWSNRAQDKPTMRKDFKFMSDFRTALEENGVPCTDYVKRDEIMVKDAGDCKFNGVVLSLTLFPTTEAGNQVYEAVKSLMSGYLITSNNWWLSTDDEETAKTLEGLLGISVL
jgi:hypothetical protein